MDEPENERPFRWVDIHVQAKEKLALLEDELRSEISAALVPFPESLGEQRQFLRMLEDQVNDWVERADNIYAECLRDVGRERSPANAYTIWTYGLSVFISEKIHGLVSLACGMDDEKLRMLKISAKHLQSYPPVVDA